MEDLIKEWLFDPTVGKIVSVLAALILVVALVRLLQRVLRRYIRDTNARYRARKLTTFLGYLLAILAITIVFSEQLRGIQIALGVAGAGIAFALQEVIVSLAGWFAITFAHYYKSGDRIRLAGIKGDVIDIGLLRTTLMELGEWVDGDLYNGRVVRVANSFVFKEPVFNYSGEFPFLWDELTIPIKYGSDYRAAQQMLLQVAVEVVGEYSKFAESAWEELVSKYMIEDARVEPLVTMTADENWMNFTVRYVVEYKLRRTTRDSLFTRILEEIDKSDQQIAIASASMEISLITESRISHESGT